MALAPPPLIYLGGITLSPDATEDDVASAPGTVCDSWARLDLEPFGFGPPRSERWYVRPAAALEPAQDPPGFEVVQVARDDLVEFERVSVLGFRGEAGAVEPGAIHPPNADPRQSFWLGRANGVGVSAAMSYETERVVGVFGVTTLEAARGRGYASALMRRAIVAESGKPAVLTTNSEEAIRIYERLGFRLAAKFLLWTPGPVTRRSP